MNTSRKALEWLICFSIVNLMLGCLLFKNMWFEKCCEFCQDNFKFCVVKKYHNIAFTFYTKTYFLGKS